MGTKSKTGISFCSQIIIILPGVELCWSDINLFDTVWTINSSPMFGIFAIVAIHFYVTPRCRRNFTWLLKPSRSKLMTLRLSGSLFSSLPLFQTANANTESVTHSLTLCITEPLFQPIFIKGLSFSKMVDICWLNRDLMATKPCFPCPTLCEVLIIEGNNFHMMQTWSN